MFSWLQDTEDEAEDEAEEEIADLAAVNNKASKRTQKGQPVGGQPPTKRQTVRCLAGCVTARAASMAQLGNSAVHSVSLP